MKTQHAGSVENRATTSTGRIMVLDDVESRRNFVCASVAARGHTVQGDRAPTVFTSSVDEFQPDVVVVELNGVSPGTVVKQLRRATPLRVIFLAPASVSKESRIAVARAHADGLFVEPFDIDEFIEQLEATLWWAHKPPVNVSVGDLVIDQDAHVVTSDGVEAVLTLTEYKLLELLAKNAGTVISKRTLLERVWGFGDYAPNVVEVHMSALRRKLAATGSAPIETVRGVGYVIR